MSKGKRFEQIMPSGKKSEDEPHIDNMKWF